MKNLIRYGIIGALIIIGSFLVFGYTNLDYSNPQDEWLDLVISLNQSGNNFTADNFFGNTSSGVDDKWVDTTGDTMTGNLVMDANITADSSPLAWLKSFRGITTLGTSNFFFDLGGNTDFYFRDNTGRNILRIGESNLEASQDLYLSGTGTDIVHKQELDLFSHNIQVLGIRITNDSSNPIIQGLGSDTIGFVDNLDASGYNVTASWFLGYVNSSSLRNTPIECPSGQFMTKFNGTNSVCTAQGYNSSSDIWNVIYNGTFIEWGNKTGNTTSEIWAVINNNTFIEKVNLYIEIDNSSIIRDYNISWLVSSLENSTISRTYDKHGNTTDEIRSVVGWNDTGTLVKTSTSTDDVLIGGNLFLEGDLLLEGDILTVIGTNINGSIYFPYDNLFNIGNTTHNPANIYAHNIYQAGNKVLDTSSKVGNTTTEIRAQFSGSNNITIVNGQISYNGSIGTSGAAGIWSNISGTATYDGNVNITGNLTLGKGTIMFNDTDAYYYFYNGSEWKKFRTDSAVPRNAIMPFNLATCPDGWILADGTSGTPNLHNEKYDTGWISRSDWTNVHLGSNTTKDVDSNVTHNLNANLSDLIVKVLISTDGTDANSFEVLLLEGNYAGYSGYQAYQVDNNNIKVQTAINGISTITDSGSNTVVDTEDWYYKVVVSKKLGFNNDSVIYCMKTSDDSDLTASTLGTSEDYVYMQNTSKNFGIGTITPESKLVVNGNVNITQNITFGSTGGLERYDTGWISRSDWTNVHLGSNTTKDVDSNVIHNLNADLSDLIVKMLISTDGTDGNSFSVTGSDQVYVDTTYQHGYAVYQVDENNLIVQTGASGITYPTSSGTGGALDTEDWYYKIKVWKLG